MLASRLDSASTLAPNRRTGRDRRPIPAGLREHTHRGDRRLELVADIGDEIAPGGLHSGVLGLIVG